MRPAQSVPGRIFFYVAQMLAVPLLGVFFWDVVIPIRSGSPWGPYRVVPTMLFFPLGALMVSKHRKLASTAPWIWILPLGAFLWELSAGQQSWSEKLLNLLLRDATEQIVIAVPLFASTAYSLGAWWAFRKHAKISA